MGGTRLLITLSMELHGISINKLKLDPTFKKFRAINHEI